jgi:uncharacterized membrane protein
MIFFKVNRSGKEDQPLIKIEWTPIDWILEGIAILGLLTILGTAIYNFPKLPDTIPTHFNASGQADGYGDKYFFWILPGISVFLYLLLILINLIPHKLNYPVKITLQNALKQYTMGTRLIRYLKMILIWLFFYINYSIVQNISHTGQGLGLWFLPVFLGFIFIPVIVYFILSMKKN